MWLKVFLSEVDTIGIVHNPRFCWQKRCWFDIIKKLAPHQSQLHSSAYDATKSLRATEYHKQIEEKAKIRRKTTEFTSFIKWIIISMGFGSEFNLNVCRSTKNSIEIQRNIFSPFLKSSPNDVTASKKRNPLNNWFKCQINGKIVLKLMSS